MMGDTEGSETGTGSTGATMTGASMTAGPTTGASTGTEPTTTADSTASDDATDDATGGATGTVDDTTGDTGVAGCVDDEECGGSEPFCLQGTCVTCSDVVAPNDACEGADPAAPFCVSDACVPCSDDNAEVTCVAENPDLPACLDGQCVQCSEANSSLCEEATPACVAGECAPCSFHSQCPASACQLFTGECLDATPQTIGPDPTHDFATLAAAFASVPKGGEAVFVVYNNAANAAYEESVQLSGDRVIALLGADGMRPIVQGNGNHAIRVDTGATLLIENLRFSGFDPNATLRPLQINDGRLALDRTEVVDNRATISLQAGSEARLRNTVIGVSYTSTPAVMVSGSSLDALYTTLIAEGAGVGVGSNVPAGISCSAAVAVNVRNSIISNVHATTPSIAGCDGVTTVSYSATREAQAGMGNVVVGALDTNWFTNWPADLRLSNAGGTTFADVAQWQTGDPPTDLDTNLRPTVDGTADYAGAHHL